MTDEELITTLKAFEKNRVESLNESARNLFYAIMKIVDERDKLLEENKRIKDENFRLDYQNTRIKGALFEFEINYYEENLKGNKT